MSKCQIWNGQAVDWHEVVVPRRERVLGVRAWCVVADQSQMDLNGVLNLEDLSGRG